MNPFLKNLLKKGVSLLCASALLTGTLPVRPAFSQESDSYALLNEIRIQGDSISIKTDKAVSYNAFKLASPPRIVVELSNTENAWKMKSVNLKNNKLFSKVRSGQFQNEPTKIARVVIDLKTDVQYQAKADGNQIVLTASPASASNGAEETESEESAVPTVEAAAPTPAEKMQAAPAVTEEPVEEIPSAPQKVAASYTPAPSQRQEIASKYISESTDASSLFGRQPVTLDFYDIDVKELFKILGEKAGVNVVFGNNVAGTVSIQLRDVAFKDAVDTVLALKNLRTVIMGSNIIQVMSAEEFDTYKTRAISSTKVFPINYAKASDVNTQLGSILNTLGAKGKTMVDDRTNSIIVTDTPDGIEICTKLIKDLDKPTPQVMIEAKIVEVALGKNLDLGITWGTAYTDRSGNQMFTIGGSKNSAAVIENTDPALTAGPGFNGPVNQGLMSRTPLNPSGTSDLEAAGSGFAAAQGLGLTFGFVKDVVRLNAQLSALQQKNKSRLLSNPKIATLNNQAATIKSQTSEPYITQDVSFSQGQSVTSQRVNTVTSGISLTVTPTINADGRITMKILPDVTSSQPTSIGIPKTTSQQANTTVIVRDGETFVIGGLISETESDARNYVPILGAIPLLGHLFKKTSTAKRRSELLVFVTPRIIPF